MRVLLPLVLLLTPACTTPKIASVVKAPTTPTVDVAVSRAPFDQVAANWKQRLDQRYVYVEHAGDYRELGRAVRALQAAATAAGIEPAGPLFALFFDDPGSTPTERLRSRACLPVAADTSIDGLAADVLPGTTVAYAVVAGAYPEVPRAYPGLLSWMANRNWQPAGPIREIYLVDPGSVANWDELRTEVQIPWIAGA